MSNFVLETENNHFLRLDHIMFIYDCHDCNSMRLHMINGQVYYIKNEDVKKKIRAYFTAI